MKYTDFFIGLLDKGEWKVLLMALILTFSFTYMLKIIYFIFVPDNLGSPLHIRLIAILSGFIAAALYWPEHTISMHWYVAGSMLGALSIALHHVLIGVANMKKVKEHLPFIYRILKGSLR